MLYGEIITFYSENYMEQIKASKNEKILCAIEKAVYIYHSFATTVSQLKICDFTGQNFKGFEVLQFSMSATTTQLLSSGEFCNLRYDTTPVKSAYANVSFYTNNSKNAKLWVVTLLSQTSDTVNTRL